MDGLADNREFRGVSGVGRKYEGAYLVFRAKLRLHTLFVANGLSLLEHSSGKSSPTVVPRKSAYIAVVGYGATDQSLITPFEDHQANQGILITNIGGWGELRQNERVDFTAPCFATIHSRTSLPVGFVLRL